jgi:signal transduction histidine kinase/integral membrane sensor domain MASE1/CheY-like chemotaxis protein
MPMSPHRATSVTHNLAPDLVAAQVPQVPVVPMWQQVLGPILFGVAFYTLARLSISLPGRSGDISYVWLANGLAVGVLLSIPPRRWPAFVAMAFLADLANNFSLNYSPGLAVAYATIDSLQAPISVALTAHFIGWPPRIDTLRTLLTWMGIAAIGVNGLFSLIGSSVAVYAQGNDFSAAWRNWFIGGVMGLLLMAPLIFSWLQEAATTTRQQLKRYGLELIVLYIGLGIVTYFTFSRDAGSASRFTDLSFLAVPFLVWAALRHGLRAATLATFIWFAISLYYTINDVGPFAASRQSPELSVLHLQLYLVVLTALTLITATIIRERSTLVVQREQALRQSEVVRRRSDAAIMASKNIIYEINPVTQKMVWEGDVYNFIDKDRPVYRTVAAALDVVHPDDRARLAEVTRQISTGEVNSASIEYRHLLHDGTIIHVGNSGYAIDIVDVETGQPQRRIVGFIKNITSRVEAEAATKRLEAELRQAQKMEAVGQLAGGIAHDFNNILAAVLGYGEMARDKLGHDPATRRYVENILTAGERGRALVAQILAFSRKDVSVRSLVEIAPLLEEILALLRGSYNHPVSLDIDTEVHGQRVLGDATALHQLIINVCTNGLQSMNDKTGRLGIRARMVGGGAVGGGGTSQNPNREPFRTMQGALLKHPHIAITVTDEGIGIDAETRARMFDPFFTTKAPGHGTGLGLSLVASIARSHDALIDIDSAVGKGTAMTLYIPTADDISSTARVAEKAPPLGAGQRILVVDDEVQLREMAQELLMRLNYEPVSFTSSTEALAAFEADPDRFAAVLSDEVMPELTGTQLALRVHQIRPALPVVLITGYGGAGFELRATQAGVARVLRKPYRLDDIAEALDGVLRQGM